MERKARIILVSGFLILTVLGLVTFFNWIRGPDAGDMTAERHLQFDGSVSGLSIGSDVRYLGVRVGRVSSITLSRSNPGRVEVMIGTDQLLPDSEQLVAILEPQGITGLSLVELRDRTVDNPGFDVEPNVIPGYPSLITQLSASAGQITASVDHVLKRANQLLNDRALENLDATFEQVRILTENMAGASADLESALASVNRVSAELEQTLPEYRAIARRLDKEVLPVVIDAGKSFQAVTDSLGGSIDENRDELAQLMEKELPTLVGLTDELARTLQEFNEMVGNINEEPGALLYGERVQEVEISLE
jgi:phospholipid/cholesterol/gamma-HCH transport system substrate-binding protein